ncbi:MAG: SusC/RagA family TonB-linked outer membrane protein [Bacteroidales bacterium]|nr:SusC/RagA family TonB-linked outer membrane protein [Bacteroidales bacterium]
MVTSFSALAQNISVSGTVKDEAGEPIVGANVVLQGSRTVYTLTDASGAYKLSVPGNGSLDVSCMGYVGLVVPVDGRSQIDIVLKNDAELLDETIVVAFGTSTREAFTGSAKVIGDEKLQQSQVTSVTNALAGAVAGVQLTSSNGAPGASATIRIRGIGSISAGNDPLIIVDGAPFGGDLNNINPSDIESMTVLKDAASNALYGARGANGVIMITTKRAKRGDAVVTLDAKVGVNTKGLQNYKTIRDPAAYYEAHYSSLYNYYKTTRGDDDAMAYRHANEVLTGPSSSGGLGYLVYKVPNGQYLIGTDGKLNPNARLGNHITYKGEEYLITPDNWDDYAYRKGIRQEYNVNVSAATEKGSFFAAIGYLDNQGITKASDMSRMTGRLKADYQAKKWLKVGANIGIAHFNYNSLGNNGSSNSTGNIWAFTSQLAPIYPLWIRNGDGTIKVDSNGFQMMDYGSKANAGLSRTYLGDSNALMDSYLNTRNSEGNSGSANGYVDFDILPGLKLTINGTGYLDETRATYVYNPYYGQFDSTGGTVEKEHSRYITYNLQQILNYNHTFADLVNTGLMIGHEYYNAKTYNLWGSKSKMFDQANKELSGAVVDGKNAGSSLAEYNNEGYFARAQADYDNIFFLSGSIRRDASSRFAPENRWGTFWSVGGAWIISKHKWFNVPFVNELKFKASIGSQGNDNIGNYRYTNTFDIVNSNDNVATMFSSKGNRDITWETNTNFNAGVEFTLFDRLSGSVDYFNRNTTDMLFSFPVAPSLGYSSYYANVGDMNNHGVEVDLSLNLIRTKNVQWDINGNFTWYKNKITMLDPEKKTLKARDLDGNIVEGYQSGAYLIGEGVSLYSWYLRQYAGPDAETGLPTWYKIKWKKDAETGEELKDENGEKIWDGLETTTTYTDADYLLNGKNGMSPMYGGFGTSLQLYGFDFAINFSYQLGGMRYDSQYQTFMASATGTNIGYNYHVDLYNAWTPDNKETNIPRFHYGDNYAAAQSDRWLTNASYLNIENVNFGYTFPAKLTEKVKISSLRIYCAAENLGYWSMRTGFDPRQGYGGADASSYSPMRTISGGITLKF